MVGRLRRRTVLASVSTGAAAATAGCLLGGTEPAPIEGSWPMRGHDAAYTFHDGGSSPPAGPPTTDWRASFSAEQGSVALLPPLVGHERVYLTVHRETSPNAEPERTLRAVRSGGESVWHVTGPNTLQDGTVLSGGILVFADPTTAGLVGVDATDGDTVWRFTPEGGTASFSRVADGTAYATAATDSWVATDAAEGHRRHRFPIGDVDGVYNRFALADGHIVAHSGRDGRLLRSIDATTGEEDWRRRLDADVAVGPTVVDDLAIVRLDAPRRGAVVAHSPTGASGGGRPSTTGSVPDS